MVRPGTPTSSFLTRTLKLAGCAARPWSFWPRPPCSSLPQPRSSMLQLSRTRPARIFAWSPAVSQWRGLARTRPVKVVPACAPWYPCSLLGRPSAASRPPSCSAASNSCRSSFCDALPCVVLARSSLVSSICAVPVRQSVQSSSNFYSP
jgi:hypothetical protein